MIRISAVNKTRFTWRTALAIVAGLCLVFSLFRYYAYQFSTLFFTMLLFPLCCCGIGLLAFQTDLFRRREYRVLLAFFCWFMLSIALSEKFYGAFTDNRSSMAALIAVLFVCYPLGCVLEREERQRALALFAWVSVALVAAMCLFGILCAAGGTYYETRFGTAYGVGICPYAEDVGAYLRLTVLCYPNAVGMAAAIALLLSLYLLVRSRRWLGRGISLLCAVILYCAVALTVSRTAMVAVALGMGLFCFRFLYGKLSAKRPLIRWTAAFAGLLLVICLSYLLFTPVTRGINAISGVDAADLAAMEEQIQETGAAEATAVMERPITGEELSFSGRTTVWQRAISTMQEMKRLWLIGLSPAAVGPVIGPKLPIWTTEMHNSLMQILVSCGLPALLLFLTFLVMLGIRSVRLFLAPDPEGENGVGYLPILFVTILAIAMMESFLLLSPELQFANFWFFFPAGVVCTTASPLKKRG